MTVLAAAGNISSYLQFDRLGSVVAASSGASPGNSYFYLASGETPGGGGGLAGTAFGYAGYRYDSEIGLYHTRSRTYDPRLGRFLQTDPIGQAGGLNIYAYAGEDPINGSDPSGLAPGDGAFRDGPEGSGPENLGGSQSAGGVGTGPYGGGNAGGNGGPAAPGHDVVQSMVNTINSQLHNGGYYYSASPQDVLSAAASQGYLSTPDLAPPPPPRFDPASLAPIRFAAAGDEEILNPSEHTRPLVIDPGSGGVGIGPYAPPGGGVQLSSPYGRGTEQERLQNNDLGQTFGCHTFGTMDFGTSSGNPVLDHQPPQASNPPPGQPAQGFPQCASCSARQGGLIRGILRAMGL